MKDKIFATSRIMLPKEIAEWDWITLDPPRYKDCPEIPCVMVIATTIYNDIVVPHQVSITANMRNFLNSPLKNVGVLAHNYQNTIFFVEEHDKEIREDMRRILKELFDLPEII